MKIEYDPNKNQRNIEERGLSFDLVALLDWSTALIWQDRRFDYPETRYSMLALLEQRLYFANFTPVQQGLRVISFRKVNKREVKRYELERL